MNSESSCQRCDQMPLISPPRLFFQPAVHIRIVEQRSLQRELVHGPVLVEAEAAFIGSPIMMDGGGIGHQERRWVGVRGLALQGERGAVPRRKAVAQQSLVVERAGGDVGIAFLHVGRTLGDDVDHPVHGIGAIKRAARTAYHFDALDIVQWYVEIFPEHAAGQGRIDAPSVHHHQKLVRGFRRIEAARADRIVITIDARDFQIGGQAQGLGDGGRAGAADIVGRDHEDGSRGAVERLGPARHRGDLDLAQLLDGKAG